MTDVIPKGNLLESDLKRSNSYISFKDTTDRVPSKTSTPKSTSRRKSIVDVSTLKS
eukprot:CAMPEP_0117428828 /NCGR_PEP_ID=MMETSP0758-20121206/8449_1 /TAXON_ID=63605 /ORGANISM="Percolomonas cosmopolitus, Strain AE-1 (ATCC 50343)" /LENGTH=55 /DNA_ID=CAMNT_0005215401 /DNA_START=385 /DNA_END=549 /DNA_ORIENTATION=-